MGVSVTASALIFFISFAICLQMVFVATQTYYEDIQDAQMESAQNIEAQLHTNLVIDRAEYNSTTNVLTINASNTGSVTLDTHLLDVLVDGHFRTGNISKIMNEGYEGGLWYPATAISIRLSKIMSPLRIKLSTGTGISCYTSQITSV